MKYFLIFLVAHGLLAQDFAASADAVVQSFVRDGLFRGSVLVAKDGQPVLRKGYGWANAEWEIPNSPETRFRLGSITKQFTAAAILQLAEAGKLKLEDPVSQYYAAAPAAWEKVTIYHLLTHSSGIPSYTGLPDFASKTIRHRLTPEQIVRLTQEMPLEFVPGEGMKYNNTGYVLLGYVIEKVSGESYAAYLQKRIFGPAGMKDSGYDDTETVLKKRAAGYSPSGRNSAFIDMSLPYAAGSLYSTVDDLLKWNTALEGTQILTAESRAKMGTPFKNNYAFGLVIGKLGEHRMERHGGGIPGFNTHLIHFPAERVTVVTLANQEGPWADRIADQLARLYFGEKVTPRPLRTEVTLPAEKLDRLVGEYRLSEKMVLKVWREGTAMITQATGQGRLPVAVMGENKLYAAMPDAELEFEFDESGQVKSLVLHQGGRDTRAPKIP